MKRDAKNLGWMTAEFLDLLTGLRVVDADFLPTRRGDSLAVRAERQRADFAGMAAQRNGDLAALGVPDLDLLLAGGCDHRVVRAEGQASDGVLVATEGMDAFAGRQFPNA